MAADRYAELENSRSGIRYRSFPGRRGKSGPEDCDGAGGHHVDYRHCHTIQREITRPSGGGATERGTEVMGGSGGALKTFIAGIVTIGMATAVLSNGRQTIGVVKAV